ncbi:MULTISPECIES: hypothetical protein [unclassified Streptomyces]|uniref:Uncharacterized protein n=1 Tax=Streptomyces sp. NBC_00060 TaxID=2975636 RepID=A0AAU2H9N0_9ACTN
MDGETQHSRGVGDHLFRGVLDHLFNDGVQDNKIALEGDGAQDAVGAAFATLTLPDAKLPIVTPRSRN